MSLAVEDEIYLRNYINDINRGLLPLTTFSTSQALDFPGINDGETKALTIPLVGAVAGAVVAVGPPAALEAGLSAVAVVIATNVVEIRLHYDSTGAGPTSIDPASGTYKVTVFIP